MKNPYNAIKLAVLLCIGVQGFATANTSDRITSLTIFAGGKDESGTTLMGPMPANSSLYPRLSKGTNIQSMLPIRSLTRLNRKAS